jgi:hypothetical protein
MILWAAFVVGVAVFGTVQARLLSPRSTREVARAVGAAVLWLVLSLGFVVVVLPVSALGLVFRRRPFGRPKGLPAEGWIRRPVAVGVASSRRTSSASLARAPRAPASVRTPRVLKVLTIVVTLVVIDLGVGAVLAGTQMIDGGWGETRRNVESDVAAMMDAPPIRDEPWARRYGEDLAAFELRPSPFVPYTVTGFDEFHSPYINTTTQGRRSYGPSVRAGVEPLRVAFFGGSAMFGVGQRDEHTIPSAVAHIAEASGVLLEVANFGHLDWVSWQEQQYFERLLARDEPFDLVVFYDGFDELRVQQANYSVVPSHDGTRDLGEISRDYRDVHHDEPGYRDDPADLFSAYGNASGIVRLVEHLTGEDSEPPENSDHDQASSDRQADAAVDIYRRSTAIIANLARDHRVPVALFWQPIRAEWDRDVIERLPPEVTDLSDVFADRGDELYLDDVHTNEEGARLVAEAVWEEIGPQLERLERLEAIT